MNCVCSFTFSQSGSPHKCSAVVASPAFRGNSLKSFASPPSRTPQVGDSGPAAAYIRGLAYLELGAGQSAAAQFQKLIDNPGISVRHVIGPLARLQLGRAEKMMGDEAAARKAYETFLDLWKDADADLPVYRQAKTEYAKLRKN